MEEKLKLIINLYRGREYEAALMILFPFVDSTAKKRRPEAGVGERIKDFIRDELKIITALNSTSSIGNFVNNKGEDMAEVIYKFARNSLIHEGEIEKNKLAINERGEISFGPENWGIPNDFILGLLITVVAAPENKSFIGKNIVRDFKIDIKGKTYILNSLWGQKDFILQNLNIK